jgi:L,D-transpeptidase ErfK/SrfK
VRHSKAWGIGIVIAALLAALPPVPHALAAVFPIKDDDLSADRLNLHVIQQGETLLDVARLYHVGYTELVAANPGVDPWLPEVGRHVRIPSYYILPNVPRRGIVINLAAQRLYYFHGSGSADTYPVGVGELGRATPLGLTRITQKVENPTWTPPASVRKEKPYLPASVPPGPDNPLGAFAMRLGWPSYLIHGTNVPDSVGRKASAGCIRLYPEDIADLFSKVPLGTPVRIVREEVVAAWVGDRLVIEVYPNEEQAYDLGVHGHFTPKLPPHLNSRVRELIRGRNAEVDWAEVNRAGMERTGLPVRVAVSHQTPDISSAVTRTQKVKYP